MVTKVGKSYYKLVVRVRICSTRLLLFSVNHKQVDKTLGLTTFLSIRDS